MIKPSTRSQRRITAASVGLVALSMLGFGRHSDEPGSLHVSVQHLPACEYGTGYEYPMRVELQDAEGIVATAMTAGAYMGSPLDLSLYVPVAVAGRYTLRIGFCPSLLDEPTASIACTDVDWVWHRRVRLTPQGIDRPQRIHPQRIDVTCLPR